MKKKILALITCITMAVGIGFAFTPTADVGAYGYVNRSANQTWYANGGWVSGWFTLHGTGYSYPSSGSVTSRWIDSGSAVGHWISGKSTWTAQTPRGVHLYGTATNNYGVNTAWVNLNITADTQTIGIQF